MSEDNNNNKKRQADDDWWGGWGRGKTEKTTASSSKKISRRKSGGTDEGLCSRESYRKDDTRSSKKMTGSSSSSKTTEIVGVDRVGIMSGDAAHFPSFLPDEASEDGGPSVASSVHIEEQNVARDEASPSLADEAWTSKRDDALRKSDLRNSVGERRRNSLVRAPSVDYLPAPPRAFSLNPGTSSSAACSSSGGGDNVKKKKKDPLKTNQGHGRRRPGAMRVRTHDDDIESGGGGPVVTDLTTIERSNNSEDLRDGRILDDLLRRSSPPAGGDIMTQAELVNDAIIAAVPATPDWTDELKDRVKMLEEASKARQEGRRNSFCFLSKSTTRMLLVLALSIVVGIVIFVVRRSTKAASRTEAPSQAPSIQPSSYPTPAPSQFPSSLPTVDIEDLWTTLVQSKSPGTTFDNETSPEYLAMEWMITDPFTRAIFNDTNRVLQRFAVAVFWYATGANLGGGWLDERTECNWGGTALRCNAEDAVIGFYLMRFGLSGTLPKELGLLSAVEHLGLDGNQFEGTIPSEIGQLTNLTTIDMAHSPDLGGTLPTEIGLLTALTKLLFGENSIEGPIPTEVGMLSAMDLFASYDTNLTGTLPSEIGLMTAVTVLDIAGNSLSGTVPSEVAALTNLDELHLYENDLVGTMPSSLCDETPKRKLAIDCEGGIECTCCVGPWPGFVTCDVLGTTNPAN